MVRWGIDGRLLVSYGRGRALGAAEGGTPGEGGGGGGVTVCRDKVKRVLLGHAARGHGSAPPLSPLSVLVSSLGF